MIDISSPLRLMGRRPELRTPRLPSSSLGMVFIGLAIVVVLYFGREVLVPIALAVLLSFALAPIVSLLRRCRLPNIAAVSIAVVAAFLVIFGIGAIMARQVTQLAENLPKYQVTIAEKIESLRGMAGHSGVVGQISNTLENLRQDISKPVTGTKGTPASTGTAAGTPEPKPIPVEIQQPAPKPLEIVQNILSSLMAPLATTGIVVIFAIFILLYRQDLRDRFIRLAGSRDLRRTTEAMDDATQRLSRYFLIQTAINASFGIIIGTGLWIIGVPNPILWGIFAALMRFVPYIGAFIAAIFPCALAVAVDPGWSMLLWTVALFLIVEPVMGQVVEPLLYGHNTGLSPVAVVVAATFWTWLWGPIGLLLSTPLTVCLVVLGRHVERLEFLEIILGDKPALTPEENFYQRMLAGDPHEAADQAEQLLKERSLSAYYDEVAIRGLALAQADVAHGSLEVERLAQIRDTAYEVVDDLSDHDDEGPATKAESTSDESEQSLPVEGTLLVPDVPAPVAKEDDLLPAWRGGTPVLCIGGRSPLDEAAASMLAQLLEKHGIGARCEPREMLATGNIFRLDTSGVAMVCLSHLDASKPAEVRYLVRRLRRKLPKAMILTGFWGVEGETAEYLFVAAGADLSALSLRQAVKLCLEEGRVKVDAPAAALDEKLLADRSGAASAA